MKVTENLTIGSSGSVRKVQLEDGKIIEADIIIASIGVTPNTSFAKGVALDKDGGLNADVFLRSTSNKDVYGAGDLVSYPYFHTNDRVREEHLTSAVNQGATAAWNMLGKMVPYQGVPFYWSRQYNKSIAVVGKSDGFDKVIVDGTPDKFDFAAFYFKGGKVIAASGMMRSKEMILLSQAIRQNLQVTADFFDGNVLNKDKLIKLIATKGKQCNCSRSTNNDAPCRI